MSFNTYFINYLSEFISNDTKIEMKLSMSQKNQKELNFMKYTLVVCINYLDIDLQHDFYFNFNIEVFLINRASLQKNYSNISVQKMINELRLRCKEIKEEHEISNDFVKILITLRNLKKDKIITIEEVYVMNNLSCDLLISNDIIKFFKVIIHRQM